MKQKDSLLLIGIIMMFFGIIGILIPFSLGMTIISVLESSEVISLVMISIGWLIFIMGGIINETKN